MSETISGQGSGGDTQGGRRTRQAGKRPHKVEFRLTDEELALLDSAARRSGRARGAFAAEAALAAAQGRSATGSAALAEAVGELMRASGLVRRIGANLNQAVAKLNSTGQRSGDLLPYARESLRRAEILTTAAEEVRKAIR
jgi:ABC-type transporter Mla subunit MlaD